MRRTLTRTGVSPDCLSARPIRHSSCNTSSFWASWGCGYLNTAVVVVSAVTEEPTEETLNRIHGELERQIYPRFWMTYSTNDLEPHN